MSRFFAQRASKEFPAIALTLFRRKEFNMSVDTKPMVTENGIAALAVSNQ